MKRISPSRQLAVTWLSVSLLAGCAASPLGDVRNAHPAYDCPHMVSPGQVLESSTQSSLRNSSSPPENGTQTVSRSEGAKHRAVASIQVPKTSNLFDDDRGLPPLPEASADRQNAPDEESVVPVMAELPAPPAAEEIGSERKALRSGTEMLLVDFHEVLWQASGQNPQVNFARERIQEALAELDQAEILWLPSLRAGVNYHYHDGNIQNTRGEILDISRNSLFGGLASRAVGGGSVGVPGVWMQFHLADAIFQPRVAEQTAGARQSGAAAMRNDTLLAVALAYLRLLERIQEQAIAQETLEHARQLSELCHQYAEAGLSPRADADRVYTEQALRENRLNRAVEETEAASTELVRLLSGDPNTLLLPREISLAPIELVDSESPARELVATALGHRPELHENRALVGEAIERLNRERYAPLIPSVLLGLSYGALGGGNGGTTGEFRDRVDFDVAAWWEIRQLGLGERAIRDANRSRLDQARWRQVQLMDQVAQEVSEGHVRSRARKGQIETARESVRFALDSHRRNMDRIQQGEGLPIEALQSVQALDAARRDYLRAVVEYNQAQFELYRALGWPISDWPNEGS